MMRRNHCLWLIAVCMIVGIALSGFSQNRRHDQIMKDVASTFADLKKSLDAKNGADASQTAAKLAVLFKEVESFWVPLKGQIAVSAARDLQSVSEKVAASAASDLAQANALYATAGAKCKSCHDRHRTQMPDGSFRIMP